MALLLNLLVRVNSVEVVCFLEIFLNLLDVLIIENVVVESAASVLVLGGAHKSCAIDLLFLENSGRAFREADRGFAIAGFLLLTLCGLCALNFYGLFAVSFMILILRLICWIHGDEARADVAQLLGVVSGLWLTGFVC